jgi:hypothetical protein
MILNIGSKLLGFCNPQICLATKVESVSDFKTQLWKELNELTTIFYHSNLLHTFAGLFIFVGIRCTFLIIDF